MARAPNTVAPASRCLSESFIGSPFVGLESPTCVLHGSVSVASRRTTLFGSKQTYGREKKRSEIRDRSVRFSHHSSRLFPIERLLPSCFSRGEGAEGG